jgi:hypothetical protein
VLLCDSLGCDKNGESEFVGEYECVSGVFFHVEIALGDGAGGEQKIVVLPNEHVRDERELLALDSMGLGVIEM